jgi:hypothetical protein
MASADENCERLPPLHLNSFTVEDLAGDEGPPGALRAYGDRERDTWLGTLPARRHGKRGHPARGMAQSDLNRQAQVGSPSLGLRLGGGFWLRR